MLDLLKRTALVGVGLAFVTKEKIEELGRELSEKAKLSEEEGKQFIEDLRKKSAEARNTMEARVSELVRAALAKMDIPCRADVDALRKRLVELEAKIQGTPKGE